MGLATGLKCYSGPAGGEVECKAGETICAYMVNAAAAGMASTGVMCIEGGGGEETTQCMDMKSSQGV